MDRSRALLLITLLCVRFSRISAAEVKKRVRLGDNVTLYCDCVISLRTNLAWFRNCSDDNHPPLLLKFTHDVKQHFSRFSFVRNSSSRTYDLLVKNISEKDLGIYYCARIEKKGTNNETVYHHGNLTTKLYLKDMTISCEDPPQTTATPPVSDCSVCWKLLVSVCPVCVLLSSLLSSTCVYFICRSRNKGVKQVKERSVKMGMYDEAGEENQDVCYASLYFLSSGQRRKKKNKKKMKKKKSVENSDFSTYSEVKTSRV